MGDFFELVDWSTGNVIAEFDTEEEALADLLAEGREYGFDGIRSYALLRYRDGHPTLIAMEDELVAYLRCRSDSRTGSFASSSESAPMSFDSMTSASMAAALGSQISSQLGQLSLGQLALENAIGLGSHLASGAGQGIGAAFAMGEVHRSIAEQRQSFTSIAEQMWTFTEALYSPTITETLYSAAVGTGETRRLVANQDSTFSALSEAMSSAVAAAGSISSETLRATMTYDRVLEGTGTTVAQRDSPERNPTGTSRLELVELDRAA